MDQGGRGGDNRRLRRPRRKGGAIKGLAGLMRKGGDNRRLRRTM